MTIQGQTAVNCTGTAGTSSYSCTATDKTILVDAYANPGQAMWNINWGSANLRITGITFEGGNIASGNNKPNGFITMGGAATQLRVDNCNFNTNTYSVENFGGGVTIFSPISGVFDHNKFEMSGENNAIRYYAGSGDFGDTMWSQPTNLGSGAAPWLYAENNIFSGGASNDCNDGGKMVIRHNTIEANPTWTDTGLWQAHQMGQGTQRDRGCRALEIYQNYIVNPNPSNLQYAPGDGSTTGVAWGNTISSGYSFDIIFQNDREAEASPVITAPPTGIGYCGSNSSGVTSPWDGNSNSSGYPCINQTGRGQGDLLNGQDFPNTLNTATNSMSWPHNLLEPWYVWSETIASGQVYNAPCWNNVCMVANRDFYVQTSPFNGSTGVGVGVLSARPASCTPGPGGTYGKSPTGSYGVAYWSTDVNGGTLYVCTSTNTWTAIYTPYTYPHPLTGGGAALSSANAPQAPTNLSATVQ
jgi:hypothetical protein